MVKFSFKGLSVEIYMVPDSSSGSVGLAVSSTEIGLETLMSSRGVAGLSLLLQRVWCSFGFFEILLSEY